MSMDTYAKEFRFIDRLIVFEPPTRKNFVTYAFLCFMDKILLSKRKSQRRRPPAITGAFNFFGKIS